MFEFVQDVGCVAIEATSVVEALQILETRIDIRTVFTDLDTRGSTAGMWIHERWPPPGLLIVSS